jgi:hypothetical protein
MHSMSIVEQRCPRCSNRRTVHLGYSRDSFCFNCRLRWNPDNTHSASQRADSHPPGYTITAAERARLQVYRAAVSSGFYSDWR